MELGSNYAFFLYYFDKYFDKEKCISLDFGCGNGDFMLYAKERGYKFKGVENYCDEVNIAQYHTSPMKEFISVISSSERLPFEDKTFDFVTSVQVFEHVEFLDFSLGEIKRVLKDHGKVLCTFPFKYSYMEGHYGIPFMHWFPANSKTRKLWTYLFYKVGFGYNRKRELTFDKWCEYAFDLIDNFCYYRTKREFLKICKKSGYIVSGKNKEKIMYQLRNKKNFFKTPILFIINIFPNRVFDFLLQLRGSICLELVKDKSDLR